MGLEVLLQGLILQIQFWLLQTRLGTIVGSSFTFQGKIKDMLIKKLLIQKKNIFLKKNLKRSAQKGGPVGFWPLPESFWPDVNSVTLPQRSAHPSIKFSCTDYEPMIIENLPFDKYELEPSPLTQYLLARKHPKVCWQVKNFEPILY